MNLYDLPKSATKAELRAALEEMQRRAVAFTQLLKPLEVNTLRCTERQWVAWHNAHSTYCRAENMLLNNDEELLDMARRNPKRPEPEALKVKNAPRTGFGDWIEGHTCWYHGLYKLNIQVCQDGVYAGYVGSYYVDSWDDLEEAKAALQAWCEAEL